MKSIKYFLMVASVFLSGCSFEPRACSPDVNPPPAWRTPADPETTECNLRWWESLADPVLNELILVAVNNNKDLQVAAWRVREYLGNFQIARAPLFPQLDLEALALRRSFPFNPSFLNIDPPGSLKYRKLDFLLSYEIDLWGKFRSQANAAFAQLMAQIDNRRTVVLTLVSSVARDYVTLRELDLELQISYQTLASRKESLQLAIDRFEGGLTSEIEVTQAASAYDETLAEVVRLEAEIPQQENDLSVLLGQNPHSIMRGRALDQFSFPCTVPAGLPSELLVRRPDILKAEEMLLAANAQIGMARAAFFPQISLTALYGWESLELQGLFSGASHTWQYGTNLLQTIFAGGALRGQLKVAEAQQQEAIYNYQQVVLNAFKEVENSLVGLQQAKKLVDVETDRVKVVKEYLQLAWLRYYEGQTDYLVYLDAERQLYRAEISLAKAQGSVYLNLIALYKALGGGWVLDADANLEFCASQP